MNSGVYKRLSASTEKINNGNVREMVVGFCFMPLFMLCGC